MSKKNYLRKMIITSSPLILLYLLMYLIYAYLGVYVSDLFGNSIDVASGDLSNFETFTVKILTVIGVLLISMISYTALKNLCKKKIFYRLRSKLFSKICEKQLGLFEQEGSEVFNSLLINDVNMLEKSYVLPLFTLIEEFCMLIIAMGVLFSKNIGCAIFVFFISFVPVILPNLFMGKLQNKMAMYAQNSQNFLQTVNDCMDGFEIFKNYNATESVKKRFLKENTENVKAKRDAYFYMDIVMAILGVASNMMLVGILIFSMFLALRNAMSIGEIFSIMFIAGNVVSPIANIAQNLPSILGVKLIIQKYNKYFENAEKDKKTAEFKKSITMKNVELHLGEREILHDINLSFDRGKKYTLVGSSGSGKSTILKVILGYFDQYQGDVCFDGDELQSLDKDTIFENLTYVAQKSYLYTGTLRENITMFNNEYTDDKVLEAIHNAQLDKMLNSLEHGLDTIIEEAGKNFSGGEKQRIAIARALLRGKHIFVLDEVTSALDYENYLALEQMLVKIPNVTLISVTHRIQEEIMSSYDKIYAFQNGQLNEEGSFVELVQHNGYFRELWNSQKVANQNEGNYA